TVREIRDVIQAASSGLLLSVEVFDVFEDVKLGAGKKSIAFHLVFGADDRTLGAEERTSVEKGVMDALTAAGFPLR
ncbi:MAG TPA: hypothetical protein VMT52_11115, partial [Planctomycetota bacterium]|nr:hypothetical protein [Planctomycetota bacterium]